MLAHKAPSSPHINLRKLCFPTLHPCTHTSVQYGERVLAVETIAPQAYLSSSAPLPHKRPITHSHFKEAANHTPIQKCNPYRKWVTSNPNLKYSLHDRNAPPQVLFFILSMPSVQASLLVDNATSLFTFSFCFPSFSHVLRMKGTNSEGTLPRCRTNQESSR
jgi:hypothetical protein